MIQVDKLSKAFGGVVAVNNVSVEIPEGKITGLIGPNGAGKSTLFNLIAGSLPASSGHVYLNGEDITGLEPHQLFTKGILRTFQIAQEFHTLTVLENLMMVPENQSGEHILNSWFAKKRVLQEEKEVRAKAEGVLDFLGFSHLANEAAGNLSGGQKKLLELGRTMMVEPKIVLLDEVGAGVNRTLLGEIESLIVRLNKEFGYTFCLVEHDMGLIGRICDPVIVMAEGEVLTVGTAEEVMTDQRVIDSYLGSNPGRAAV